jgi:hypothetical protein
VAQAFKANPFSNFIDISSQPKQVRHNPDPSPIAPCMVRPGNPDAPLVITQGVMNMHVPIARSLVSAAIAGVAALSLTAQPAAAATFPASHPRVLVEYDREAGQQPENVVVTPDGKLNVVLSRAAQIQEVTPGGHRRLLASLPQPADGGVNTPALSFNLATGLVRTDDGTLYVGYAAGDDTLTGIWRIRPGGKPQRVIPLSASSLPNGMALDERTGRLYIADSTRGIIWRAPITGGTPTAWASGAAYEPTSQLGVNGLKVHKGAVWVSNSAQSVLLRVPIKPDGSAAPAGRFDIFSRELSRISASARSRTRDHCHGCQESPTADVTASDGARQCFELLVRKPHRGRCDVLLYVGNRRRAGNGQDHWGSAQ